MTARYAEVIGDPISHSKSPLIHKFWLEKLGTEGDYRRCRVSEGSVEAYLKERLSDPHWAGCNATMPLKTELYRLLVPDTHKDGDRSGAFNCAFPLPHTGSLPLNVALAGANTDRDGLITPLSDQEFPGERLVIIGSGASARTALSALGGKYLETVIVARNVAQAQEVLGAFCLSGRAQPFADPLPAASLLVNASPLGMSGFPLLQLDLAPLPATSTVYDLVYEPLETPLLRQARARGLRTLDGLTMLIGQAARSFELFFKQSAPRHHDRDLRALLTS